MTNLKDKAENLFTSIGNKYDKHIKKQAIKKVDEKLILHNLKLEDIDEDDYETMVNEAMTEIKKEYATNTAKVGLSLLGIDLLFG